MNIINNLTKSDTSKIQLKIAINFIPFKNNDEEHVVHSKIDDKEIMINHKADKVIIKLLKWFVNRY